MATGFKTLQTVKTPKSHFDFKVRNCSAPALSLSLILANSGDVPGV